MAISKRVSTRTGKASYQVKIDRRDALGQRNQVTIGTYRTKKEAQRAEREALDAVGQGTYVERDTSSVSDLLDLWLASKTGAIRGNTLASYRNAIEKHLKPELGTRRMQDVKPTDVQRLYNGWRDAEMGASLLRSCHRVLSAAFSFAVRMRMVAANPCQFVTVPTVVPKQATVWSDDDLVSFLGVADDDPWACLWRLLIETGMRRGEALGLRWADVDWHDGVIHIRQTVIADGSRKGAATIQSMTKTDAGRRSLAVSDELMEMLRSHRREHMEHDLVTCTGKGTPLPPRSVGRRLDDLCVLAGVDRVRVHDLRHLAATRMARAGVPQVVAQMRMGHTSSEMTRRVYQHADISMQRDAVAALALPRALRADGDDGKNETIRSAMSGEMP